jgi:hypothetical protein
MEFLIRMIYVEMLGHDASFGYMKAVEVRKVAGVVQCALLNLFPHSSARQLTSYKSVLAT